MFLVDVIVDGIYESSFFKQHLHNLVAHYFVFSCGEETI
jgi:hypothetical protein